MAQRSPLERQLLEKAARYLPGGNTGNTNYPETLSFLVREGCGSHLWDISGNEYIDWLMGSGPMILGHALAGYLSRHGHHPPSSGVQPFW